MNASTLKRLGDLEKTAALSQPEDYGQGSRLAEKLERVAGAMTEEEKEAGREGLRRFLAWEGPYASPLDQKLADLLRGMGYEGQHP